MRSGTSHSGHRSPGRRTVPFAARIASRCPGTSVPCLCALCPENSPEDNLRRRSPVIQSAFICGHTRPRKYFHAFWVTILVMPDCVSSRSLNLQLSIFNSEASAADSAQSLYFHSLSHSSITSQQSLLCFHNLTNSFSRSSFLLTTLQIAGGCHPPFANFNHINSSWSERKSSAMGADLGRPRPAFAGGRPRSAARRGIMLTSARRQPCMLAGFHTGCGTRARAVAR